jgi:nicotinate-nucleotide adenylyltransferase
MKIALFFGSFNPIHIGHLIIANYIAEHTEFNKVWLVVSPQNPFKEQKELLDARKRLFLCSLAVEDNPKIEASSIEFNLPKPSYTIDTLVHLKEKFPQHEFSIIMGEDNLTHFHKWKNYEKIVQQHKIFVYRRLDSPEPPATQHPNIHFLNMPILDISASFIRQQIKEKKSIQYLVTDVVRHEIEKGGFYK